MSATARPGDGETSVVSKMGLKPGLVVQELGWDEDADDDIRVAIEDAVDGELVEEAMEAVDVVLLWWRDGDGDLVDGLVDALTDLDDSGYIWLLTPKVGRDGFVDATDVAEGAVTAGLAVTSTFSLSSDWSASKLVPPKGSRR
ncbi:hypothetical protein FHX74_003404 [Friedmanniella endophytica]|uniref:DUF3052 domain-containing protein n=1 Tax=Microlunatus kandeliicorticis TaxID=1759536 RepID=A0A7W3P789_9ACTN|nr:DUF3052 domain-containing protein [Microlunatus kandeliicorticis]MBA8795763.1 hypothetical protein [Microlunatus kandeliicorticis]